MELFAFSAFSFSALTLLVGQQEEHPTCKNWVVGCWHGHLFICGYLWGADLHMAQLIPLPLTVSRSRKSRLVLVLSFWYQLTRVVPDKIQRAIKWL